MEYQIKNILVPVYIKYDFVDESYEIKSQKEWIECRLNLQPADNSHREIQIYCYPADYFELLPFFTLTIDYATLRCGSVSSRTRSNAFGLFWTFANKNCRILLSFNDYDAKNRYVKYMRNMLAFFRAHHEFKNGKFQLKTKHNQINRHILIDFLPFFFR